MATHTNKKDDWVDTRARETYVSYCFKFFNFFIFLI